MPCYCPLHAPQPGCPGWQALSPSARNTLAQVHQAWPRIAGSGRSPPRRSGILPSLGAAWPCLRKPGRLFGACSPQTEEAESPQPNANTPQAVACQPGPLRTTPWLLHMGADKAAPTGPAWLRMALIVSWGPLGARPTQAGRVLRPRAAGPWMLVGRCLQEPQPCDGHSGLPLSSAGCVRKPWMCSR